MGVGAISFGLCVILVLFLQPNTGVNALPIPAPEMCWYHTLHGHQSHGDATTTTTAAPSSEKPKEDMKEKVQLFGKLLQEFLSLKSEADQKKEEEEKKAEEEKKKAADATKGFTSVYEFWSNYWEILTTFYNTF